MAISLLNWALKQTDVKGAAKCVLIVLANRADKETHQCFPSLAQIIEDSGFVKSTVAESLLQLERVGKIRRETRHRHPTAYTVLSPPAGLNKVREPDLFESASRTQVNTTESATQTQSSASRTQTGKEEKEVPRKRRKEEEPSPNHKASPPPPSAAPRPHDRAADIFAEVHRERHHTEYIFRKGDWVWLANLRRAEKVENREAPEFWRETCSNYLSSPMGGYTLAYLCSHYAVFLNSGVDRFNQPNGGDYGRTPTKTDANNRTARDIFARIADKNSRSGERDHRQGDDGDLSRTLGSSLFSTDPARDKPDD